MALTNRYSFETLAYTTTGWNGSMTSNAEKFDEYCWTYIPVTCGESISQYHSVCIRGDSKAYKAQADGTRQPCIGLAIEAGVSDDVIRVQRVGEITNSGWSWTPGLPVYLGASPGGVSQTWLTQNDQIIGVAKDATTIILEIYYDVGNTTQTVTSTTSTSSTTICTTSTHTSTSTCSSTTSSSSTTSTTAG